MTTDPQTARTPYCHKIRYGITGAPILTEDEMDGSHAPGIGVSPSLIELVYSAARDGKPATVSASVTGSWTRFGEPADGQVAVHFKDGPDGWPAWLVAESRLHDPDAAVPSVPVDRAAVLAEAAARYEEILAKANTGQDPRYWTAVRDITLGLRRMADEEQQPETQARDVVAAIVAALQVRAGELSELAEEQMRPSLEERAQEWHQAANVARRAAKNAAVAQPGKEA